MNFLFWNIARKPLQPRIARLVEQHAVDVLVLVECSIRTNDLLGVLNKSSPTFVEIECRVAGMAVLSRLAGASFSPESDHPGLRLSIHRISQRNGLDFLLAIAHLPSKLHWTTDDQTLHAMRVAQEILLAESKYRHHRTVLVGDLNMDPFEPGMVGLNCLHALMTRQLVQDEARQVRGSEHHFFYNPMWGCFGDRTPGPPGTYYHAAAKPIMYYWHMFDQVLFRPAMLPYFQDELRILNHDGSDSLVNRSGRPDRDQGSDHLPIFFRLNF